MQLTYPGARLILSRVLYETNYAVEYGAYEIASTNSPFPSHFGTDEREFINLAIGSITDVTQMDPIHTYKEFPKVFVARCGEATIGIRCLSNDRLLRDVHDLCATYLGLFGESALHKRIMDQCFAILNVLNTTYQINREKNDVECDAVFFINTKQNSYLTLKNNRTYMFKLFDSESHILGEEMKPYANKILWDRDAALMAEQNKLHIALEIAEDDSDYVLCSNNYPYKLAK